MKEAALGNVFKGRLQKQSLTEYGQRRNSSFLLRKVIIGRKVASRPALPCFTKDSIYVSRKDKKEYPTMRLFYTRPSLPFPDSM